MNPLAPRPMSAIAWAIRSEEHTSELQSRQYLVCRLLLEKKKKLLVVRFVALLDKQDVEGRRLVVCRRGQAELEDLRHQHFFFNDTATTEIYTLSLHDALPIRSPGRPPRSIPPPAPRASGRSRGCGSRRAGR